MPYITPKEREELDPLIDALTIRIKGTVASVAVTDAETVNSAGRLNYAVTRMMINLMGPPKYWKIALFRGVLADISAEFYRRAAAPYEDKKIAENGDVYPPT